MHRRGFSLVELVVAIGLFSIVGLALFSSWQFIVQVLQGAKNRTVAVSIASERAEIVRNMTYDDIGVSGSIPPGVLAPVEEEARNGVTYTVRHDVRYIDDPYDGVAPTDTLNIDYKQVRIEVSWSGYDNDQPVIMWSNVAPRGVESNVGGGTLRIEIIDSDPSPLPGASVRVFNPSVVPSIDFTVSTNSQGIVLVPGMPVATASYQISVTKSGFTTARTYDVDPLNNPHPDPGHVSIVEGLVTDKTFVIDDVSSVNFRVRDESNNPLPTMSFRLTGQNHIGYDGFGQPIPAYDQVVTANQGGELNINTIDFDTYNVTRSGQPQDFDIASSGPPLPFVLLPAERGNVSLIMAPHTDHSLLVRVVDNDDQSIIGATVRLYNAGDYDETKITDSNGYAFFSGLSVSDFTFEASATDYQSSSGSLSISGTMRQNIPLADQ